MTNLPVPRDIRVLSRQRALVFHNVLRTSEPNEIAPGQIWSTHARVELPDGRSFETDEPRLVVILDCGDEPSGPMEQVTAAPVSLELSMAAEWDLIVPATQNHLRFSFMVEVWNETPVLKSSLRRFLGEVSDEATTVLRRLCVCQLLGEDVPDTVTQWVGIPIMGERDPRLVFQEAEIEVVAYLARAATAMLALDATEPETVAKKAGPLQRRRVFSLRPEIGRLSDLLRGPQVAHASGTVEEARTYVFREPGSLVLELLGRRRPPYQIYVKVHEVSPELEGRRCVVTVITAETEWQSAAAELRPNAGIQIGEDPGFRREQVETIEVKVE